MPALLTEACQESLMRWLRDSALNPPNTTMDGPYSDGPAQHGNWKLDDHRRVNRETDIAFFNAMRNQNIGKAADLLNDS